MHLDIGAESLAGEQDRVTGTASVPVELRRQAGGQPGDIDHRRETKSGDEELAHVFASDDKIRTFPRNATEAPRKLRSSAACH